MTQTSTGRHGVPVPVRPAPQATRPANPADAGTAPAPALGPGRLSRLLSGSPGRLRIAAAVSALGCLLFAAAGALAMQYRANALEDARSHAAQVVRVQKAAADLVRADAAVSNGFLRGGLEPAALTAEYDEAVGEASRLLVDAAAAQPADRTDLARAAELLTDYTGQIARARDNNRLGLPLGSGYLVVGSQTVLRGELLPLLDEAAAANRDEVEAAYSAAGRAPWLFALGAVPALVVLGWVSLWLARRTHRVVNVGLAAAALAVVVGTGAGALVLGTAGSTAQDVRSTAYAATRALATARAAAYSAKGLESLTLVKQGGGAAYEEQWKQDKATIDSALAEADRAGVDVAGVRSALGEWQTTHSLLRRLDNGGDWPTAVVVATRAEGAPQPAAAQGRASNADFRTLVQRIDPLLATQASRVSTRLAEPWGGLQAVGWAILVLGVLAAVAAVGGIAQRLGEYR